MAWHDGLSADDKLTLADRYPGRSFDEIAILAVEHPKYGHLFERFGVEVIRSADDYDVAEFDFLEWHTFPELSFSGDEKAFRELVVATALAEDVARAQARSAAEEHGPYSHAVLEALVKLRLEGASHDKMHEAYPQISKRQARYIAHAVDAKKLRYTRYGLEGVTRTDEYGAYIPRV